MAVLSSGRVNGPGTVATGALPAVCGSCHRFLDFGRWIFVSDIDLRMAVLSARWDAGRPAEQHYHPEQHPGRLVWPPAATGARCRDQGAARGLHPPPGEALYVVSTLVIVLLNGFTAAWSGLQTPSFSW